MKRATKLSEVFRLVREYMEDPSKPSSQYICCNIEDLWGQRYFLAALRKEAVTVISRRLDGASTVERWLYDNNYITYHDLRRASFGDIGKKIRAYRIAWLRELEREFKRKESKK